MYYKLIDTFTANAFFTLPLRWHPFMASFLENGFSVEYMILMELKKSSPGIWKIFTLANPSGLFGPSIFFSFF